MLARLIAVVVSGEVGFAARRLRRKVIVIGTGFEQRGRHVEAGVGKELGRVPRLTTFDDPLAALSGRAEKVPEFRPKHVRLLDRELV